MNKTINQLSDLTQVENDDELVVWDITAGTSKKAKARQFKNIFISATSTTVTGAGLVSGSVVKIMFTSTITGSDTTTGLSISYNGTSYPVKVGKQGSLVDFVAHDISGTYTYLQAYTTLELAYDGTQFVIIGNPIVLSSDDYTIYADGLKKMRVLVTSSWSTSGEWIFQEWTFPISITDTNSLKYWGAPLGGTLFATFSPSDLTLTKFGYRTQTRNVGYPPTVMWYFEAY